MSNYRRMRVEGGTYFFTVNLADRRQRLLVDYVPMLRVAFIETKALRPFIVDAIVVLPDHLHCVWTLPPGDCDFSSRWRRIKAKFSAQIPAAVSTCTTTRGERGIWQRRFWEHVIRDDADYRAHFDYIHYNPVRHGHVSSAANWPFSSFHRYVRQGIYPADWACAATTGEFGERGALHARGGSRYRSTRPT